MAWSKNYKTAGQWSTNQRSGAPYRSNAYSNNQGGSREQFKKSGAEYSRIKKGKHEGLTCVNAWRKTRFGLVTASAFPVDGVIHTSNKGVESMRYVVTVVNRAFGTTQTYWCMMGVKSQVIGIPEIGLCITPNGRGRTASGKTVTGYFGKFGK
ncbi:hypothetical protein CMU40_18440 [Elizabethkingia anophelis]|uniref:hypothetical protein n=1 Tax=Elizabethkingia anophelis TaxID=1117645 RepID=UPI0021A36A04|nr:hypothetical protein [Elizabethkingia anophelis]MCT3660694.1 hypothetical protein [Elizabethkingia anophelis]MCT3667860.1 hypothetical protein [Elizabethkingia anophelis]MCT3853822.1 hypothetical protein [Elizabethkingia anophelis]MCT3864635.1 hypothetical protein [Elizabethkingia anophelis]